jgi:hypothetical protein
MEAQVKLFKLRERTRVLLVYFIDKIRPYNPSSPCSDKDEKNVDGVCDVIN